MRKLMQNENIYLERISISNFRAYPKDFVLALPPGPGVTILSGPNGLGKTSLFEAVEWAMTGDVRRLSALAKNKLDGRYLLRQESGNACEVSLVFTGDLHVRRLQTVGTALTIVGNDVDEIATAIRAPDRRWNVTGENLANYLQLTHLHAQTADMRLVSWEPDARWVRVSPLAGADRFDRVRANLKIARTGLTRTIRAREQALEIAAQAELSWLRRLDEFRTSALVGRAAHDSLSPSEALELLGPLLDEFRLRRPDGASVTSGNIAVLITETRHHVDETIGPLRGTEARLRGLQDLPSSWARAKALLESVNTRRVKLQTALAEAEVRLRVAQQTADERSAVRATSAAALVAAEQRHRVATTMQLHQETLGRIPGQLEAIVPLITAQEAAVRLKETALQTAKAARDQLLRDSLSRDTINKTVASVRTALGKLGDASEVGRQLERESRRIDGLRAQIVSLRETHAAFEVELAPAREQRAQAVASIEREGSRLGDLARAVISITTHLTDRDDVCPVCKSEFPPKLLRERALADSDASSAALIAARKELEAAERNVIYLEAKGRELLGQIRSVEQEVSSLSAMEAQLRARVASLRSDPLLVPLEGAERRLRDLLATGEAEVATLSVRIQLSPAQDPLVERIAQARAAVDEASREIEKTRAQYERLVTERSELTAKVESARTLLGLTNENKRGVVALISGFARVLAGAQEANIVGAEAAAMAKAANDVALQECESAREVEATSSVEVLQMQEVLSSLRSRWTQGGLDGDPSGSPGRSVGD
jgi:exonuclease SbcC